MTRQPQNPRRQLRTSKMLHLIGLLALSAGLLAGFPTPTRASDRPNFVFFLVDDLGWTDLGCFGSSFYETPNIDGLAASGMRFTNAYAACPV